MQAVATFVGGGWKCGFGFLWDKAKEKQDWSLNSTYPYEKIKMLIQEKHRLPGIEAPRENFPEFLQRISILSDTEYGKKP